jgi:tetratricopeptide (TPR) repeat protein
MIDFEIARTLADAARRGSSGLLTARRGKLRRLICLRNGRLVHVASNVLEEQLEALLAKRGLLRAEELADLRKEAASGGAKPGTLLLRGSRIAPKTLYDLAVERTRELLHSTLEWQDGEFAFAAGRPQLEGELTVDLPLLPLLYEHAHGRPLDVVRAHLASSDARSIRTEHAAALQRDLGLEGPTRGLLEMCDGFLGNADVLSRIGDARGAASRALYALHVVGALRFAAKDEVPRGETVEAVTREELLARLVYLDEGDHYAILGLNPQSPPEQVREAYYFLARRYHPDRYRAGELQDLLPQIEAFFTRVTEAYNILADPAQRRQYDEDVSVRSTAKPAEPQQDKAYLARQNYARGKLLVERKQLHEAVRFLENAIELDPLKPEYHLELGRLLARNPRRRDDAERLLVTAVERNPALLEGYRALAELLSRAGRLEEAAQRWEELLRWDPQDADALAALGRSRRKGRSGG